jgi:hypothetical protein
MAKEFNLDCFSLPYCPVVSNFLRKFFELKRLDFRFRIEVNRIGRINPATPFHPRTEVTGFSGYSL